MIKSHLATTLANAQTAQKHHFLNFFSNFPFLEISPGGGAHELGRAGNWILPKNDLRNTHAVLGKNEHQPRFQQHSPRGRGHLLDKTPRPASQPCPPDALTEENACFCRSWGKSNQWQTVGANFPTHFIHISQGKL